MAASKNNGREAREARERLRRYNARQSVHSHQLARRKRDNYVAVGALVVVAALAAVSQIFYFNGGPGTPSASPTATASATAAPVGQNVGNVPSSSFAENKTWTGTLTLNSIPLAISLDGAAAPQAVSSFLASVTTGYYTGKTCHRLVSSATAGLIQCGSVDGTGASDPSYSFGPIENPGVGGIYPTGTIAMARAGGDAYSQGRQFFIVTQDATLPDDAAGGYTIIGQVTSGLDALQAQITNAGTSDGSADGAPLIPTTITSLTIN